MMSDAPHEPLDRSSGEAGSAPAGGKRNWLGIQFECCTTYSRIYKNGAGTAYVGWCPRCGRRVNVAVGPGGTDARFFRAT